MVPAIKAEFRKLLTVRSTYIVAALAFALVIFFAFYIEGWQLKGAELLDPSQLSGDVTGAINTVAIFAGIIGILLITHEYRYNTIMYTLTATNNRSKMLIAKILAVTAYAVIFSAIIGVLSPFMSYLGVHAHGHTLVAQHLAYGSLLWECLYYGWGMAMAGLLFGTLLRNQVGAIAALFIVPNVAEQLLTLLLKKSAVYLPFSALSQVVGQNSFAGGHLDPGKAALIFLAYIAGGWAIAWILFLVRDAN